jgi:hypothetical protein
MEEFCPALASSIFPFILYESIAPPTHPVPAWAGQGSRRRHGSHARSRGRGSAAGRAWR